MFDILADIAVTIGSACADRADYLSKRSKLWVSRGRLWSDLAKWLRLKGTKPLAEIRAERAPR